MIAGDVPAPAVDGESQNRFKSTSTKVVSAPWLASAVTLPVMLEQTGNQLADDFWMNGVVFGATILAHASEISSGSQPCDSAGGPCHERHLRRQRNAADVLPPCRPAAGSPC
jgi:hypothetical protein